MPQFKYRELKPTLEAKDAFCRWLAHLDNEFTRQKDPIVRSAMVRDELHQIYLGRPKTNISVSALSSELALTVFEYSFDPLNITLEPEYYGDIDPEKYAVRKPLIWFWQMFDRSPLGLNHWLGFRFRAMLGKHIFKHIGENVKIFHGVEFSFGYNLTIEDNCVIHKYVMLDDRGELIIRKGSSISDYANVYTHTHDLNTQADVTNRTTEIGPGARLTYHSTVLAGANVRENAMVAAMALATKDVPAHMVYGGIPAKKLKDKREHKSPPSQNAAPAAPAPTDEPVSQDSGKCETNPNAPKA
jgi:acetyltransferase-like isoleucine patch superfamily enzyme